MTRNDIYTAGLHPFGDYTTEFFTTNRRLDSFDEVIRKVTKDVDFPELRKRFGYLTKSSTKWDITNPTGTTMRYTYVSGWQADENISIGDSVKVYLKYADANNNLTAVVTGVTSILGKITSFDIVNTNGVVESGIIAGSGYIVNADIVTVKGQQDYALPNDLQKIQGNCVKVDNIQYDLLDANQQATTGRYYSCWMEDGRIVFNSELTDGAIIDITYYRVHEAITSDTQTLEISEENGKDVLVAGMSYKFSVLDNSIGSEESMVFANMYERQVNATKFYLLSVLQKGRILTYNDAPNNTWTI